MPRRKETSEERHTREMSAAKATAELACVQALRAFRERVLQAVPSGNGTAIPMTWAWAQWAESAGLLVAVKMGPYPGEKSRKDKPVVVRPRAGAMVEPALSEAIQIARILDRPVSCSFNGIDLVVTEESAVSQALEDYHEVLRSS